MKLYKNTLVLPLLWLGFFLLMPTLFSPTMAQDDNPWLTKSLQLQLKEESRTINATQVKGYSAYVAEDVKKVAKEWKNYLKDKYGFKLKKYDGYLKTKEKAMLGDVAVEKLDVYVIVTEDGQGSRVWWAIQDQMGQFVDGELFPERQKAMEKNLRSFAKEYYNEQLNKVFEKASKEQKSLNKGLKKAEKDVEDEADDAAKSAKNIAKNESKVTKEEQDIREAQQEIKELKKEIEEYKAEKAKYLENKKVKEAERKAAQATASQQSEYLQKVKKRMEEVTNL